ncbi:MULTISPECIES: aldehyde dehydrogenase [unclassified Novosphingobium]|uniref:aldehyde dehydrogenase n=1 Tax=unclassified Novosphingobium TaxID=2644732 RepID=UPI000D317CA9|nr:MULTISPECIES: aldehyde dehydrogenase [unclassified Novosphingobium]PTR12573.1 betaine-aldehyde dehydrogenase [Novosphingobium sp. GV055]PUB06357.1 betaine-aldehyde dehydrogenase [Novosphingobium sp. GV061]PUB22408.1 betaine-aldehyde dehydrogenase [Novosphingobium sp. GV079]PUB44433.1 betaine-aldehyde dehydrogenase [Novosphingobium sp. GV027]
MTTTSFAPASPLAHPDKLYIGGSWVPASSGRTIEVINPASEGLYTTVAEANEVDVAQAIAAARDAFDHGGWPWLTPAERAQWLRKLADAIDARADDFASVWSSEMGVIFKMAKMMSGGLSYTYRSYADIVERFPFVEEHPTVSGAKLGLLVREPVGVVGAIVPWNAPAMLAALKVAPALAAGCTVVLKASPEAPGHALLLAEVAESIGLPAGVLNVITADRAASEVLVRDSRVDKISFTGSSTAGCRIASILGERMARYTLELGGKSAAVILDDYDIETAAATLARRAPDMTGQVCAALTRVIVSRHRHDAFLEALSSAFGKVRLGDPFDPETRMGPLATARQRERVEAYLASGRESGATLATGGGRPAGIERGWFIEPTVFGNVDPSARIAQEEIFGPVLSVIPAQDEAEAVRIANDTIFGLNNAVFTNDVDRAYAVARQLRSGTVGHNGLQMDFTIAFGGFKMSGVGREGGVEGLKPYLESKTVLLQGRPNGLSSSTLGA